MLEDVLNSLITRFLGEYIKDIDKKDLKVSMWKGDVKLKNLEVKTEALDFLQLPVDIKSGFVGELDISIPWKDIGRKPTKVNISKIFVVVCPRSEIRYDEESYKRRQIDLKRQQLKAIDEKEAKKKKELHEKENNSLIANLINKIIRNFEMTIDEIHIRYEDRSSNPKHPFCAGISLEKISISPNITPMKEATEDDKGSNKPLQHNGVFSKDVLIHRFGVYWDSNSKAQVNTSNSISLIEDMEAVFTNKPVSETVPKPQNFIIRPLSVVVGIQMDIRGVELRKPTPEQAAMSAMHELGWNTDVLVNQNFIKTYCKIKKDGIRGRDEKEETDLFIEKFKQKFPKFCSSQNFEFGKQFSKLCWKYANTASPVMIATASLPQLTIEVLQDQIRDLKILLSSLSSQAKRSQYFVNRPTSSIVKKPRKWWKYAIKCVMEDNKKKKEACSWKDYLEFKEQRNEYINLYKRVLHASGYEPIHKDKKALKRKQELEDLFSVENTVLFRKMAQVELEKEQVEMINDSSDSEEEVRTELYKELELSKEDMNAWQGGQPMDILFSIDFQLTSTQIIMKKETQKLMDVCIDGIALRAYKRKEYLEAWVMVYDVKILDTSSSKTRYNSILSIHHMQEEAEVKTPRDEIENDGELVETITYSKMTSSTCLLPVDLKGKKANPFVQAHLEIPSFDNSSGCRVEAVVQTMDIIVNIPWFLEVMKFFVPDNIVVMSHYEEKAYNMITALRNGDANLLTVVQNNKGMNMDVLIQPINIIIPDSCTAHRSKTQIVCCQVGEIYVDSKPNERKPDVSAIVDEDLYNTIAVKINDFAVGVVNGRAFAKHTRTSNCILNGLENCLFIKPFAIDIALKMCLINELRWVSTDVAIKINPILIQVTQQSVVDLMNWLIRVFDIFVKKQKELDLDVMAFLLQPKQLLFSCIEYNNSPLLCCHDISSWKSSPQKLQKILYREVMAKQNELKKVSTESINTSSSLTQSVIQDSLDLPLIEEKSHGVVHLTYEDLLLLQYKPGMRIAVGIDQVAIQIMNPKVEGNALLALNLNQMSILYQDHFYDMTIQLSLPSMEILDSSHINEEPKVFLQSIPSSKNCLDLEFCSVGELSMLNEFYDAATNVRMTVAPLQLFFNAAIVNSLLDFIPPLPSFPASQEPTPAEEPKVEKPSIHQQEGLISLQVTLDSFQFDLMTDTAKSVLHLSLDSCGISFYQGRSSTHIVASLHNLSIHDNTEGCGFYPEVLAIQLDNQDSHFLAADIMLVKRPQQDIQDTTIDVQIQAPILTLRYRFIQELLLYLSKGEIAALMQRFAKKEEPVVVEEVTEPQPEESLVLPTSSGIHQMVKKACDSLFTSLVASNVIREVPTGYVLPRVNVCLNNLVVIVPCTSSSQDCIHFELGKIIMNNQESSELNTAKLFEQQSTSSFFSEMSMSLEGLNLITCYHNNDCSSQALLHNVNLSANVLLSSVMYCKLRLSPILISMNQYQLDFLLNHLVQNFAEQAVMVYPEIVKETVEAPVPVKDESLSPVESDVPLEGEENEKPAETAKPVEAVKPVEAEKPVETEKKSVIGQEFYVDIILDSFALELLKDNGGYEEAMNPLQPHPSSVCLLECSSFFINTVLSASTLSLSLTLGQISFQDTRSDCPYLPILKAPITIGNEVTPALTLSLLSSEQKQSSLDLLVGVHVIRVFPTPLFLDVLSLVNSFSSALVKEEKSELAPEPVPVPAITEEETEQAVAVPEKKSAPLSPSLCSLLASLHISIEVDPISIYCADSFTQPSPFILINAGVLLALGMTSSLDLSVDLALRDVRIAQCSDSNLIPLHDCNDILQSWNVDLHVGIMKMFKKIVVEMNEEQGLHLSIGYRDIQILLHCLENLQPSSTTESLSSSIEGSDIISVTTESKPLIPQIQVPLFVSKENPLDISATLSLKSIQIGIVSDIGKVEVPFIQLVLSDLAIQVDYQQELVAVIQLQLSCDFYNQLRIAWEPLIEPWSLMIQLIQRCVDENQKDAVGSCLWQDDVLPMQTSCTIHSDSYLTTNLSVAFCSTALALISDLSHYMNAEKEEVITEDGYYMYIDNQLGVDCEMEVIYDGGMMKQLETIRKQWETIETRQISLQKEGFAYCIMNGSIELLWVEIHSTEPHVLFYKNEVDSNHRSFFCQSVPSSVQISANYPVVLTCQVIIENEVQTVTVFSTLPSEWKEWNAAVAHEHQEIKKDTGEEKFVIPSSTQIRTSLPAHPSIMFANSVESYNQRLISIRLPNCRAIECCCDYEDQLPFSIFNQNGEYVYDIIVEIANKAGRRIIVLSPLLSITNSTVSPLSCRFVTDEEAGTVSSPYVVKQSQKKQINLENIDDNYYGISVSAKSPYFDKESKGFTVRQVSSASKPFTTLQTGMKLFCPIQNGLKGRIELNESSLNSINLRDITSLNMRRTVLNMGTSSTPHYVLLRCCTQKLVSDTLKPIQPAVPPQHRQRSDTLRKLTDLTVDDVYGMIGNQRSLFALNILPILTVKNGLPVDLEYKVVFMKNNQCTTVSQGTIVSTKSQEIHCINPEYLAQYGFLLRPKNTQFVWNQQILPVQLNSSGHYILSDMENSQTTLQYDYQNQNDQAVLVLYSKYWIINRTNDVLFACGKKDTTQVVKLPANSVQAELEKNKTVDNYRSLQPILFSGKEKKPILRLRKSNTDWSNTVKLLMNQSVKCCIPAVLPYNVNDTFYSISFKRMEEPFANTCLITISPYYLFINQTNYTLSIYEQQCLFTLSPLSCYYCTSMQPSKHHLLSIGMKMNDGERSINSSISQPSTTSFADELKSAKFDCDYDYHYDIQLTDKNGVKSSTLLSVTTGVVEENQTITISSLQPESISYCIVNNTSLSVLQILQVSTDFSSAVTVQPLSSQMYILPNLTNSHEVGLFLRPIHTDAVASDYQPRCLINLDTVGEVTSFFEDNPKRKIHIHIEVENSTNILIVDEEVIAEEKTVWKEKKKYEFDSIILEEALTKTAYDYTTTTTEINDYVAAITDFEKHASESISLEGTVVKQPAVIVSKESRETIDLMLNDSYYYFFIRNVSIRNLQRKPCSIRLRCSNGENMIETAPIQGSHVFINKEMLFKQRSSELQLKVVVEFEKNTLEFDSFLSFSSYSSYNNLQFVEIAFGSTAMNEMDILLQNNEENVLCNGGSIYLYCVHCKNNRINDNQKEYLPSLLYKQYLLKQRMEEVWKAQSYVNYQMNLIGVNVDGNHNHTFIEEALHEGVYENRNEEQLTVEEILKEMEEVSTTEWKGVEESNEIEEEKSLRIEIESCSNLPCYKNELNAYVMWNDKKLIIGESKKILPKEEYSTNQYEMKFDNVFIGCTFAKNERGQFVVNSIEVGSEADKKGVLVGMTLWGINGKTTDLAVNDINQRIEAMHRPLQLTFLAPYRNPSNMYMNCLWNSSITLPKGSTVDRSSFTLCIEDKEGTVVYNQAIPIQRYHDWSCKFADGSSAITSAVIKTHWVNELVEKRMINTSINLDWKGLSISLFNKKPIEVLNAVLDHIKIDVKSFNNQKQSIAFSIQKIQIDNQLLNAMEPVLLGSPETSKPVFSLSCTIPSNSVIYSLQDVTISLTPLLLAMDNHLLVAVLELIGDFPFHYLTTTEKGSIYDLPEFRSVSVIPTQVQNSVQLYFSQLHISDLLLSVSMKVDPSITTTSIFLPSIPYLTPVQTILDTLCSLVADIDATKISLSSFDIVNYSASSGDLVKRLTSFYVPQVTKQVLKIVGSVNLLGNPVGLVEDVSSGIKAIVDPLTEKDENLTDKERNKRLEEGGKTLLRNTTKGLLNTASKITGTVGNGIATLTFNKHYKEQRVLGRKGLIHGITSGVTGVVMDPIRGAKKNGFKGAVEGVGIGLIGVVTKPFSGLLDDTTRILTTAKEATVQEVKLERIRDPSCVLCDHIIRKFDKHLAIGQGLFFTGTTRYLIDEMKDEQYVFHCCVDQNSHYFIITQYHCILLNSTCDLLWCMPLKDIQIEVDEEEMRIITQKESKLVLFSDKEICSRLYGMLINIPNWTNKEIVQCSQELIRFINTRYSKENEIQNIYNQTTVDFKSLDILSVCMIAVDNRYERKFTGNYSIKANSYQEYCLEIIGGMEGVAMVSWKVYKRYSEIREYYKSIENKLTKELKSVKFPGKKMQILGSHLNTNALQQREEQMHVFVDQCMNAPLVLQMQETKQFVIQDPVNVKYEV